ncbi:DNA excision repair protein ERCC-1-like [Porites lutea]|uniref:DNA excision repair protein ERCC-1-like n=1 Tax=Porites lutea TaxID=51062 RepID=UPI003CC6B111
MATNKRKFTVPSVDNLDERKEVSKPKSLFNVYKKSTGSVQETTDDSFPRAGRANDLDKTESSLKTIQKEVSLVQSREENDSGQRTTVEDNCLLNHESLVKEAVRPAENSLPSANDSGTVKPAVVGKTFRETFAFLDNTSHYKETVAKIKEKESTIDTRVHPGPVSNKPKSNAIIVNPRQKGNPVLKHVRNVPWEMGDIIPDYVLGATTCALFLSLRYHHFNPEYIHERLRQLGQRFELRILLVQVDVKDPHQTLRELAKMAVMADCTLILAWSPEEAGRYLETYKVYENKPPDALLGQSEGDYLSKLTDCLTTVKGVNKTDVVSLTSTFGSLANMTTASKDDLALLPGFGPLKAQRLHNLIQQQFIAKRKTGLGDGKEH